MKNIKAGWRTSIIGLVLIGGAVYSVLSGKSDWPGAVMAIAMGIGLVFSPDNIIKKVSKKDNG
jgi:hypothetical protein